MNSIIKNILLKYSPSIIFFIVKNYFGLDFLNDFNPFTSETKEFFNGNNPQGSNINPPSEGEGSNRQNNPQGSSINPEEVREVEGGVVVSGETLEQIKALYENNPELFGQTDAIRDEIFKVNDEQKRIIEEEVRILQEREAEIKQRVGDSLNLMNQGQSEESLSDINRQIIEDRIALQEDFEKLKDKAHTIKAEINKIYLDLISTAAQKMKDSTNESNSK